jgi:sarcosine oxidase subunit gamma
VLDAVTPLKGFNATINDVHIVEVSGMTITSLAVPLGKAAFFKSAIAKTANLSMPEPGTFTSNLKGGSRLVWTAPDQYFLLQPERPDSAVAALKPRLKNAAYLTDQSDSWAIIAVSGERALEALERICPVNLHRDVFAVNMAARTHMEHLGVFILRINAETYWLMSARSSAQSFLHTVTLSAENI